ncbi:MAG TPA: acyl-CoA dehydrogenase family protein [Aggregatilineales bacterium]|nr:acyl-CoA dehydrogenase family protein [Aggregatilineales bacterium]
MTISFDLPERFLVQRAMLHAIAEQTMRPYSRQLDEAEHERPTAFITMMWGVLKEQQARASAKSASIGDASPSERTKTGTACLKMVVISEQLAWGDLGQYMTMPSPFLAGAVIEVAGSPEQKRRFLTRFAEGEPKWGAMAMTEPAAGSDTSAIETTAVLDPTTNEWVLNGWKIFCTNGTLALEESDGILVVWATVDKSAGRAGMKPFVVEAKTPGVKIAKAEIKHGIRASDTAAIVLENVRIPYDNLLGDPAIQERSGTAGFKEAMATFDASRPIVGAVAVGVGRAALEFLKEKLAQEGITLDYNKPNHLMTTVERDVLEMEAQLKAAWLLTLRSAALFDRGEPNNLEASMAKVKAGKAVTIVTQKAVELLGTMGYSREWLVEKWMRDGKINDIYEGTGQINTLIVARILGYTSKELA